MANVGSTGAHPKGTINGISNHSVATRYGICTAFVGTLSGYPPDRPHINKRGICGLKTARWISKQDTVQAIYDLKQGKVEEVPLLKYYDMQQYFHQLTQWVLFGKTDVLYDLVDHFKLTDLSEIRDIYLRHFYSYNNTAYNIADYNIEVFKLLKLVFEKNNLSDYIEECANYIIVYARSTMHNSNMSLTDSDGEVYNTDSDDSGDDGGRGTQDIPLGNEDSDEYREQYNADMDARIQHHCVSEVDILQNNNIKFRIQIMGYGKEFISSGSGYPPYLNPNKSITVDLGPAQAPTTELGPKVEYINEDDEVMNFECLIGDTDTLIDDTNEDIIYNITALSDYVFLNDNIVAESDPALIENKRIKWWITVPITLGNGDEIKVRMMADTGANAGCVDTAWAWKHFKQYIRRNTRNNMLKVPGGRLHPKYVLYFSFPTNSGTILKARMYLVDNLPVNIIAGLNMLLKFGYRFKDEVPPVFKHKEEEDLDLELKSQDDIYKVHAPISKDNEAVISYDDYKIRKDQQFQIEQTQDITQINYINDVALCNQITVQDELLYSHDGSHIKHESLQTVITGNDEIYDTPATIEDILSTDVSNIDITAVTVNNMATEITENDLTQCHAINLNTMGDAQSMINERNNKINNSLLSTQRTNPTRHFSMKSRYTRNMRGFGKLGNTNINILHNNANTYDFNFIMAKQSYLADHKEIEKALRMKYNKLLEHNDVSYLKKYAKVFGGRFEGLFEAFMKLRTEYKNIFAKHTYDRRTMKVPPVSLGILPQYRHIQCYVPQYPMTPIKRAWMIAYTHENEKNGYWHKIDSSLHCIPYTMVAKKSKDGTILRYRPAFDGRVVNQYCELFRANMPTMKDFDEFHSVKGLFTMADIKNMFDNIPLDKRDQPWATVLTPMGLYRMTHLAYGWKNAATNAQAIMNKMAVSVGYCIAYIDDILLKHPWHWGTKQLIGHMRRFFEYIKSKNMLLNPTKFFPYCTDCINFSIHRNLIGSSICEAYKKKIISFALPTNAKELAEFIGIIGYVDRYIYYSAKFKYWLNLILIDAKNHKRGEFKFSKNGKIAFYQLQWLVRNSPILHNPTRDGIFCIKTDACNYGTGAVLYQQQYDEDTKQKKWVIIDMYSKVMPQQLRHSHSMVHEALAIVQALQHWQFHLIKREFIISTDNKPIASLFVPRFRDLDTITQKQLLRLRIAIGQFTYQIRHVEGLKNEVADGLSRFSMGLYQRLGFKCTVDPLNSTDTSNKELDDTDRRILSEIVNKTPKQLSESEKAVYDAIEHTQIYSQSKLLRLKMKEESQNNNLNMINNLLQYSPNSDKYKLIEHEQTAEFNQLLKDYRLKSSYKERDQITDYLNSITDETVLISDEKAFNTKPINSFIDGMNDICNIVHKLSDSMKCQLASISNTTNDIIAMEDEIYNHNNTTDIIETECKENISDLLPSEYMQTRRKTRISRDSEDPTVNKHDYITHGYDKVMNSMQTRDDIMSDLFGHRGLPSEIFEIDYIKSVQKDDNLIQSIKYLIKQKLQRIPFDDKILEAVKKQDYFYYFKLINNQLRITVDGILEAHDFVKVTQKDAWLIVIPFILRGKYLDYAHHNQHLHHLHWTHSFDWLSTRYYWPRMKQDIQCFAERCKVCKFSKGSIRHRAPLQIRELPKPREHVMCDFIGPIFKNYGKYYILAMIDYATGYTMLLPVEGCDAETVVDALLSRWIPIFGVMATIETDYGSGFDNHIYRMLMHALGVKWEYAERNNHRSIGKVERIIGFVQSIIKRYNIQLDQRITHPNDSDYEDSWTVLQVIIPHIQAAINQRRPRFTTYSPNMLMFGSQLHDVSDISKILTRMSHAKQFSNITDNDQKYLLELIHNLKRIYRDFNEDYKRYTYFSTTRYTDKWRLKNRKKIKQYQPGKYVLYYVGDKNSTSYKWLSQWSGPWKITKKLSNGTRIITDEETGNQIRVSIDRLKLYNDKHQYITYESLDLDEDYGIYENKLKDILYKYNVKTRASNINLDFRNNSSNNTNNL